MMTKDIVELGKANDSMADLLETIEDQLNPKTANGRKLKKELEEIEENWDSLWSKIVKVVKAI